MANIQFLGTGRRKTSVARVRLVPGNGNITINKRDIDEYFDYETLRVIAKEMCIRDRVMVICENPRHKQKQG